MKKILALTMLSLPPACATAADADVLREGCNALKVATKKTECNAAVTRLLPGSSPKSDTATDAIISAAKQRVSQLLNDPESVRYRTATYSQKTKAVCGVLSAKNAMGGYGSPARFIVTAEIARIERGNEAGFEYRWSELCDEG